MANSWLLLLTYQGSARHVPWVPTPNDLFCLLSLSRVALEFVLTLQATLTQSVRGFHPPDSSRLPFAFLTLGSTAIIGCLFVCLLHSCDLIEWIPLSHWELTGAVAKTAFADQCALACLWSHHLGFRCRRIRNSRSSLTVRWDPGLGYVRSCPNCVCVWPCTFVYRGDSRSHGHWM